MNITSKQLDKLEEIRKEYNLELIILHGSQVTGQIHPRSDVDIAVTRNPKTKASVEDLKLISSLSDIFKSDHIDLCDISSANPLLLKTVTDKAQVLAGSLADFNKLRLKAFHRFNDYKPFFELEKQFILQRFGVS